MCGLRDKESVVRDRCRPLKSNSLEARVIAFRLGFTAPLSLNLRARADVVAGRLNAAVLELISEVGLEREGFRVSCTCKLFELADCSSLCVVFSSNEDS